MQVDHGERLAIYADPESCAAVREDGGKALTGKHAGQPLSRERLIPGADTVTYVEGEIERRANASASTTRRGLRTWDAWTLIVREPGDPGADRRASPVRIGKAPPPWAYAVPSSSRALLSRPVCRGAARGGRRDGSLRPARIARAAHRVAGLEGSPKSGHPRDGRRSGPAVRDPA